MSETPEYIEHFLRAYGRISRHLDAIGAEFKEPSDAQRAIEGIIRLLRGAKSGHNEIILLGVGRDANILRMFSTRLRQIGFPREQIKVVTEDGAFDYVVGGPGSFTICLSGRGFTSPSAEIAEFYKKKGTKLVLITSNPECKLAHPDFSDFRLILKGLRRFDFGLGPHDYGSDQQLEFDRNELHPGPTLFEDAALIVLECIVSSLYFLSHPQE